MNKFIKNLIFVLNIFSIICNAQFVPVVDAVKEEYAKIPDVTQILKNEIDKAKMALDNVKILLSNFNNFKLNLSFDDAGYLSSNFLKLQQKDACELIFDFGYAGHGDLTKAFSGFNTKIKMVDVPEWLNDAIESTLVKLKFDSFMNISAKNEFLIKLILLFKDQKNKLILANQFTTELFFIMYRLALIKDFTGIESFLKENSFFLQLISGIKIGKNKTNLKNYLNKEWINFQDIVNYKFEIELKPELEKQDLIKSNDTKTITKIVSAIGLKTSIDYYIAREKFLKTDIGKNLDLKIVNAISLKEKILARQIFTKSLPEYNTILSETQNKIMGFLRRIEGIRNNWNQFVDKIKPYLEPFFDDIGLPFDLIVRKFENLDEKDKSQLDDSQIVFDPELGNISAMDVNQTDYMDF